MFGHIDDKSAELNEKMGKIAVLNRRVFSLALWTFFVNCYFHLCVNVHGTHDISFT